ncbi:Glyoxalase/Bleomycin resistance protein/Dioxygenase superfamily protein [Tistlia consotensis]|uniref:Glyoxalase/Bleomycin resistance protein/Dioxygenase superfamily protein n=1 Tax=Tistlia consotensis USBA 355 TaxID=560819 RepID=A0A1Y6BPD0_9PROT|nr:VOC family protein [Tistlia consotensis]SMF13850.1 Glyoxalase/Bleomycin resistance protein/Dioxygenase superfamily protein [Tistlia consotensis USBA 355]SNR50130.1 Glyoxalase/Bleomycin resistance protein/Dioxygenase superfamily protein [Tistlia consotensis]
MSRFLGEIRQLGFVVPDIEDAMRHWSEVMGVGPWFYNPRVPIEDYAYEGQRYEVHNSVALANSGFVQVELIQTRNDAPSMYRDFQRAGHVGLQHVAYWTEDYDRDLAAMEAEGFRVKMSGKVGERGRFAYFDREMHPGTVIELSEVVGPKGRLFRMIREASEGWDGSNAIRPFPDLATL